MCSDGCGLDLDAGGCIRQPGHCAVHDDGCDIHRDVERHL